MAEWGWIILVLQGELNIRKTNKYKTENQKSRKKTYIVTLLI